MTETWSVLLVDDHPLLRRGVAQLLNSEAKFDVQWQASSGEEALACLDEYKPALVVLDLNMQPMSGLDTLQAIRQRGDDVKVVVYSVSDNSREVNAVLEAGADGFLVKDTDPDELLESLSAVMHGDKCITPRIEQQLAETNYWDQDLTPREKEIAQLIGLGKSNKAIGEALFISEGTAKVHVKNVLRKTGCSSRVELALMATQD
ncbi:response regulator [Ferrimonas lipolytica]|uniref:Response regulator transcription factor n=1 Tax=Ferrimonas lipolytica TaxID=2724191 RepID=A0A6H1UFN1_9GAMM|nr:response regulator transcription factor [Ferrimonas lipolytica]QIZ77854.1 response regulator transcription factor [Ferrimonas lipolytica]